MQVYGWSTAVGTIVTELAAVLRRTIDLPVREQQNTWNPADSSDNEILFILLTPQTVSAYPMYYVAYQTEQWGTHFLDEGSANWGVPRGQNETTSYRQVGITTEDVCYTSLTVQGTPVMRPARPGVWCPEVLQGWNGRGSVYPPETIWPPLPQDALRFSCRNRCSVEHSAALGCITLLTALVAPLPQLLVCSNSSALHGPRCVCQVRQETHVADVVQVLVDALEVWDYSRHNIQSYARRVAEAQPRLQYLPFSFLSTKGDIKSGVYSILSRQYQLSVTKVRPHVFCRECNECVPCFVKI